MATAIVLLAAASQAGAVGPYDLLVSTSATRSNPVSLAGQTVSGSIYVFTKPDTSDIARVRFWLDNPQRTGTPRKSEASAPYDFAGTKADTNRSALPFDTRTISDGEHTITAAVELSSGSTEIVHATFTVANNAPPPPPSPALSFSPTSLSFSVEEDAASSSKSSTLSANTGTASATLAEDASWLDVSPTSGETPASVTATVDPAGLAPGSYSAPVTATATGYAPTALTVSLTVREQPPDPCPDPCAGTVVSIAGTDWLLNGAVTYPGRTVEGLLLNARTANAIFDDENPATVNNWAYKDTGVWDPDRNVSEFVATLPLYASKGLRAVTVSLQGSVPVPDSHPQASTSPWIVTAFGPDGSLKQAWLDRLQRVLAAADGNGVVVILSLFHRHQDEVLTDEAAVKSAVDNTVDWLLAHPYRNVVIDVVNESSPRTTSDWFHHPIMRPARVHELIARVQTRSGGRLLASSAFMPIPPDAVLSTSDFVLLHANNRTPDQIRATVAAIRQRPAYQANPTPIIFNEDSPDLAKFDAAVGLGASWGYHDRKGLQFVPVNWGINTTQKIAFFNKVQAYASG